MADIRITFDVPDVDPLRTDPLDIAEAIIDEYNDWARANAAVEVAHVSLEAEWIDGMGRTLAGSRVIGDDRG